MSAEEKNFLVFINPIAGTQKKGRVRRFSEAYLAKRGVPFQFRQTEADEDYSWLPEKIISDRITHVIICGGDGTVNKITAFLLYSSVKVGIIPVGSGNGLATAAGIPKNLLKAWTLVFEGTAKQIDSFTINDRHAIEICGLGLDAQVAHDYAAAGSRGLRTYFKHTLRNFFSAKPFTFDVASRDKIFSAKAFFISVANANQFGNSFTIAPKALLDDGLLDVVVINANRRYRFARAVLKHIRNGVPMKTLIPGAAVDYFQTAEIKITNSDTAPLHIDGEVADTAADFIFKVVPRSIWLIQPAVSF